MLQVIDDLSWDSHAAEAAGRVVHLVHRRLVLDDDFLECRQLLKQVSKAFERRRHDDVTGENIFEIFHNLGVLLEASEGSIEQAQAFFVQVCLCNQLLVELIQVVQVLLLRWSFNRDGAEGFLKVLQIRIKKA